MAAGELRYARLGVFLRWIGIWFFVVCLVMVLHALFHPAVTWSDWVAEGKHYYAIGFVIGGVIIEAISAVLTRK